MPLLVPLPPSLDQTFDMSALARTEGARLRRRSALMSGGLFGALAIFSVYTVWRDGLLVLGNWWIIAILLAAVGGIAIASALRPDRWIRPMTSVAIAGGRIVFYRPGSAELELPVDKPGYLILTWDRGPDPALAGDRMPSGAARYLVGHGFGWAVPVTSGAFRAIRSELKRRGCAETPGRSAPKGRYAGLHLYRVPAAPGAAQPADG